jgi:hypothetical protein
MPAATIPVADTDLNHPAGHVGEADVDVDPVRSDVEPGRVDRCLQPPPSSPPTWAISRSRVRPGCR